MGIGARNNIDLFVNPYVTDGLVAMWDGIWNNGNMTHETTLENGWIDCVNGYVANFVNGPKAIFSSYSVEQNHIACSGVNVKDMDGVLLNTLKTSDSYTLQTMIVRKTSGRFYFATLDQQYGMWENSGIGIYDEMCTPNYTTGVKMQNDLFWFTKTCDRNTAIIYHSHQFGNIATKSYGRICETKEAYSNRRISHIFGVAYTSSDFSCYGNLYFFRLYNRVLNKDEVVKNYEIDRKRFGL